MMYLFHRIEQRLDGTPAIIVVDEGWKALDDDVFVGTIKDWEKTIRKRNGLVGFCTQNAERRAGKPHRPGHHRAVRHPDLLPQSQGARSPITSKASA